jgi:hypothetical protein
MEQEKIKEDTHPLSEHVDTVRAEGFAAFIETLPGGKMDVIQNWLRSWPTAAEGRLPVFEAVAGIGPVAANREIRIRIGGPKKDRAKASQEVASEVEKTFDREPHSPFHNRLLAVQPSRRGVAMRLFGLEEDWNRFVSALRKYVDTPRTRGTAWAGAIRDVGVKTVKGARTALAVKFEHAEEPPLRDIGGGHLVACVLYPGKTVGPGIP